MKTKLTILSTIFFAMILSGTTFAMDLTGMWDVTYYYRNNPTTTKAFIRQTGDTFTFDSLPGKVDGNTYTVTQGMPGRRDIKVAWVGQNGMEFKASDENNFKGSLSISLYASEKSKEVMRTLGIKMIGRKIENPAPRIVPLGGLTLYVETGKEFKDPGFFAHDGEAITSATKWPRPVPWTRPNPAAIKSPTMSRMPTAEKHLKLSGRFMWLTLRRPQSP